MTSDKGRHEPNAAIFAEATGWLVDFREGCVDAAGSRRFSDWLRRSPDHIQAYMEAAALWGDIPKLAAGMDVNVEAIVAQACAQSNVTALIGADSRVRADFSAPSGNHADRIRTTLRRWTLAAAVMTVAIISGLIAWREVGRGSVYLTGIGEQRVIALPDGSAIELGARSRVRVDFTDRERDVELLAGQALFSVAKDPARPFIVAANVTRVRAVGTQFDVDRRTSGTTVTVLEGRVAVSASLRSSRRARPSQGSGQTAILVAAGEQLTLPDAIDAEEPHPHGVETLTGAELLGHTLTFDDAPLSDVVEEFNRYNEKQIVLADPALGSLRISGVFAATKPSSLLRFLSEQMQLDVITTQDRINVFSRMKKDFRPQ